MLKSNNTKKRVPQLPDFNLLQQIFGPQEDCDIPSLILTDLIEKDRIEFCKRYKIYNLPQGIDSETLFRILYYRGQGCFFYHSENDKFYFLPYSLAGSIGVYGEYENVKPLPFNGASVTKIIIDEKEVEKPFLPGLTKKVIKEIPDDDSELFWEETLIDNNGKEVKILKNAYEDGCVLIHDRCLGQSQVTTPRYILNRIYLKLMSECPALARTNLISNAGIKGMVVKSADEASNVEDANRTIEKTSMSGKPLLAIEGTQEFQEIFSKNGVTEPDVFFRAYSSFDNMRLSSLGIDNQGVFDKANEYVNTKQANMSGRNVGLVYNDGLEQLQKAFDIINAIWDLDIYVDSSETITENDADLDGDLTDDQDQSGVQGEQPEVSGGTEDA